MHCAAVPDVGEGWTLAVVVVSIDDDVVAGLLE